MTLKQPLKMKNQKSVWIAKALRIEPSRLSLILNGVVPLPERYVDALANLLQVSAEEIRKAGNNEFECLPWLGCTCGKGKK